jgi:hypothetical protein
VLFCVVLCFIFVQVLKAIDMNKTIHARIDLSQKTHENIIKIQAVRRLKGEKINKKELLEQLLERYSERELFQETG